MTYYNYILIYLFFYHYLFLVIESFTPVGRLGHSSALAGKKIYFFGGNTDTGSSTNEVFYLDVSQQFNIQVPLWNELITPSAKLPFKSSWATVSLSDINNEQTIYLFGGYTIDIVTNQDNFISMIYSYNLNSLTWDVPTVKGQLPERRLQAASVMDDSGKLYTFGGGTSSELTGSTTIKFFNDIVIFNAVELSWSISISSTIPRAGHTATLLSNGVIVYIGGFNPKTVDISLITLYDTKSSTWTDKIAKLIDPIDSRDTHTAVLAPNGKIIVHGGTKIDYSQAIPDIVVLNTETEPFEWTAPFVSSNVGKVPSLTGHTANLVENYMIVAFGNITQPNNIPLVNTNSKIYLMDIRSYTWVYTFEPPTPPSTTPQNPSTPSNTSTTSISSNPSINTNIPESNNQLTTMKVVIATISGIFGTAILMLIGFFGHRWYKKRQRSNVMRIYGNHGGNHGNHGNIL